MYNVGMHAIKLSMPLDAVKQYRNLSEFAILCVVLRSEYVYIMFSISISSSCSPSIAND